MRAPLLLFVQWRCRIMLFTILVFKYVYLHFQHGIYTYIEYIHIFYVANLNIYIFVRNSKSILFRVRLNIYILT